MRAGGRIGLALVFLLALMGCGDPAGVATGVVRVAVQTTGVDLDTDGYLLVLQPGGLTKSAGPNETVTFEGVAPGQYGLRVEGTDSNCEPASASHEVTVVAGETAGLTVVVTCDPRRWSSVTTSLSREIKVSFPDARHGRILGRGPHPPFQWTSNGGESWNGHAVQAAGDQGALFDFITPELGFFGGEGCTVGRTADAGATWTLQSVCHVNQWMLTVHFQDLDRGWLGGGSGLYRTADGGISWSRVPVDFDWPVRGIAFFDDEHGVFVGSDGHGAAFTTDDGGVTWVRRPTGFEGHFEGFDMVDDSTAVGVGSRGAILRTTDRGLTWTTIVDDTGPGPFWNVDFNDEGFGIAVGEPGVFVSRDKGATWSQERTPEGAFSSVSVLPGGAAWVGGGSGTLIRRAPD